MSNPFAACDECLEQLPLYVGADLEDETASRVAAHLARCEACREAERRAVQARAALVEAFRLEADAGGPDLWPRVRAALAREREAALALRGAAEGASAAGAQPRPLVRASRFRRRAAAFLVAAAAAFVLIRLPLGREAVPDDGIDGTGLVQDQGGIEAFEGAGMGMSPTPVADVAAPAPRGGLVPISRRADDRLIHQLPVDSPLHHVTTQRIYR